MVIIRLGERPWEVNHTFIWSLRFTAVLATVWSLWNSGMQSPVFTKTTASSLEMAFPVISGMLLALGHLSPGSAVLTMCSVFSFPAYFLELDSAWCRCGVEEIAKCVQGSLSSPDATIDLSWFTCVSTQENMTREAATASGRACREQESCEHLMPISLSKLTASLGLMEWGCWAPKGPPGLHHFAHSSLVVGNVGLGAAWDRRHLRESGPPNNHLFACKGIIKTLWDIICIWSRNVGHPAYLLVFQPYGSHFGFLSDH